MEEIIIALLFLYPGAFKDVLAKRYDRYSFRDEKISSVAKTANYFAWSVFITTVSLIVFVRFCGLQITTTTELIESLCVLSNALRYTIISFISTFIITRIWIFIRSPFLNKSGRKYLHAADSWHELTNGNRLDGIKGHMLARVTTSAGTRTGLVQFLPDDIQDGIYLIQTDFVRRVFERDEESAEEHRIIGKPWASYFSAQNGMLVEFFDGRPIEKLICPELFKEEKPEAECTSGSETQTASDSGLTS